MATYAIGDIQGCRAPLERLLERLRFDPAADRLWLTGDLVNRGPDSLGTLRLVRALGEAVVAVLGNHDLHLLAVAYGGRGGRRDTFDDVLSAPDRDELLDWLRRRPLLHRDPALGWTLIHAGLPPQWDLDQAAACAAEAQAALRGLDAHRLLHSMYGDHPDRWCPDLRGVERIRFTINCLTRLRYCDAKGRLLLKIKGEPGETVPAHAVAWFRHPQRASRGERIVFGHWSALQPKAWPQEQVWCLDTGCVWGEQLTALNLETLDAVACDCRR